MIIVCCPPLEEKGIGEDLLENVVGSQKESGMKKEMRAGEFSRLEDWLPRPAVVHSIGSELVRD